MAGQPAAGEVARPVGEHADDEDPVERARAVEQVALDLRGAGLSAAARNTSAKPSWINAGTRSEWPAESAGAPVGDRPREQLLDRPVDHRQDHEHDRPAQRHAPVGALAEHVARRGQIGEGEDAGRGDPDRQDPSPGGVGARVLLRRARRWARRRLSVHAVLRPGPSAAAASDSAHQRTRTSSIVHGNGERASSDLAVTLEQLDECAL